MHDLGWAVSGREELLKVVLLDSGGEAIEPLIGDKRLICIELNGQDVSPILRENVFISYVSTKLA